MRSIEVGSRRKVIANLARRCFVFPKKRGIAELNGLADSLTRAKHSGPGKDLMDCYEINLEIRAILTQAIKEFIFRKHGLNALSGESISKENVMAGKTKEKKPRKINKQDLISSTAEKSGLTKVQTKKAVDGVIDVVKEVLSKGDSISLTNFGSFKTMKRKPRTGRNIQTGKKMKIKAKTVPKFVPSKALKETVQ